MSQSNMISALDMREEKEGIVLCLSVNIIMGLLPGFQLPGIGILYSDPVMTKIFKPFKS